MTILIRRFYKIIDENYSNKCVYYKQIEIFKTKIIILKKKVKNNEFSEKIQYINVIYKIHVEKNKKIVEKNSKQYNINRTFKKKFPTN